MQYFGSNIVEGVAGSCVEAEMSWLEVEMSWVEVGGGGWSWVEVGTRFSNTHKRTVPGNTKYSDTVRNGKKTFIVGTSMVNGIRMKEVNSQL